MDIVNVVQKNLIKIVAVLFVLGGLVWFWLSDDGGKADGRLSTQTQDQSVLVSSIQPITDAQLAADAGKLIGDLGYSSASANTVGSEFVQKFSDINTQILNGNSDTALIALRALIKEQPRLIEPYINMASLYAQSKQLELARQTLLSGIQANPNTAILFDSLQKIHGAQAATAYKKALEIEVVESKPLILPTIASITPIGTNAVLDVAINRDVSQAGSVKSDAEQLRREKFQAQISALELANSKLEKSAARLAKENAGLVKDNMELVQLNDNLSQTKLSLEQDNKNLQIKTTDLEQGLSNVESVKVAALQAELNAAKKSINSLTQKRQDELARLQSQLATYTAVRADVIEVDVDIEKRREQSAIGLVKSWAISWSAQDVTSYIKHYADNYKPSSGDITNQQWREQRQVRLTNKDFIEVNVSEFSVDDRGSQFSVIFTQHYRSNTVDDRIRKQRIFAKNSNDWSGAKIVAERRVSR